MARLNDFYKAEVAPALMTKFGYKSVMQIPKLDKIVDQRRLPARQKTTRRCIDAIVRRPRDDHRPEAHRLQRLRSRVANFKLREGMPIGVKVTLRGEKMWEFMDRLFNVALPARA